MKYKLDILACLFCLLLLTPLLYAKEKPANIDSIVSLAPHITELLFAIGAGDKIVAVSQYSDYPEQALTLPIVADHLSLDIEKILTLNNGNPADLVIAWKNGTPETQIAQLQQLNIEVYELEIESIHSLVKAILSLGALTNNIEQAEHLATEFENRYHQLKNDYQHTKQKTYFYPLNLNPLITFNQQSLITQALALCNADNIFSSVSAPYPQVSLETILEKNPEYILIPDDLNQQTQRDWQDYWQQWPMLRAVANQHIIMIPSDLLNRATPRILDGIQRVCEYLHKDGEMND